MGRRPGRRRRCPSRSPWTPRPASSAAPRRSACRSSPGARSRSSAGSTATTWETLGTSTVQADGMGYFPGVTAAAGTVVYRVRQEDVVSGANRIGWMQTFPTYVTVLDPGQAAQAGGARAPTGRRTHRAPPRRRWPPRRGAGAASATASSRYGWYPTLWDYTWEAGQSLTSPPDVGSVRTGWWQDYSDGAGRVSRQNGGLYLDSQRNNARRPRRLRHHPRDAAGSRPGLRTVGGAAAAQERRGDGRGLQGAGRAGARAPRGLRVRTAQHHRSRRSPRTAAR